MRPALLTLLLTGFLLGGCAAGGTGNPTAIPASNASGGIAREPFRLHALAVAVCPSPTPSPLSPSAPSQCAWEQRTDLPPLANVPGLTPAQIPGYEPAELQAAFNLPPCTHLNGCFHKYAKDGGTNLPKPDMYWGAEMSIDLDMASAICPNCKLDVVESDNDDPNNMLQGIQNAVQKLHANVVSNSWVAPESSSEKGAEQQLDKLGTAIVAAAGDQGYGTAWPAAARGAIAVGGTTLVPDKHYARGFYESVWSGTGGGCSAYIPKPSWQTDPACSNRTLNDVAAIADPNPGVAVFDTYLPAGSGGWLVFGGTSVSTPIVAGAIALAGNAKTLSSAQYIAGHASFLNPILSGSNGSCTPGYL